MALSNEATAYQGSRPPLTAEGPTADNPFLTRKNRLRRAHFLARKAEVPMTAREEAQQATIPVQETRRPSPTYNFGGGMTQRRGFRPATT